MRLIEQLLQILEARSDLDPEEQLVLKTAISWLDQRDYWVIAERDYDPDNPQPPSYDRRQHPWRVRLTLDEFERLRYSGFGTVELIDGQPAGK